MCKKCPHTNVLYIRPIVLSSYSHWAASYEQYSISASCKKVLFNGTCQTGNLKGRAAVGQELRRTTLNAENSKRRPGEPQADPQRPAFNAE